MGVEWRLVRQPLAAEFEVVAKFAGGKTSTLNKNNSFSASSF
jgi:hypothetical protein